MARSRSANKLRRKMQAEARAGKLVAKLEDMKGFRKQALGGKPSKARIITRKKANEICESGESPLDIMLDNMLFWHHHTEELTEQLRTLIVNAENPEQRKQALVLLQEMLACRENSQRCAVDLAPYCHPRLAAIAFKKEPDPARPEDITVDPIAASQMYQKMIGG